MTSICKMRQYLDRVINPDEPTSEDIIASWSEREVIERYQWQIKMRRKVSKAIKATLEDN